MRRRAGSAGVRRSRRRDRRPCSGTLFPLAARACPAGQRLRYPVPAAETRTPLSAHRRPRSRCRGPTAMERRSGPAMADRGDPLTVSAQVFLLPDLGEGLTEADILEWKVAVGDAADVAQLLGAVETAQAAGEGSCRV